MCVGVPGKVLEVEGNTALVDFFGVSKKVRLDVIDVPVSPGDYLLNHVGFAIHRIPPDQVEETLALFDELLKATGEDPMAADVRAEISAGEEKADGST